MEHHRIVVGICIFLIITKIRLLVLNIWIHISIVCSLNFPIGVLAINANFHNTLPLSSFSRVMVLFPLTFCLSSWLLHTTHGPLHWCYGRKNKPLFPEWFLAYGQNSVWRQKTLIFPIYSLIEASVHPSVYFLFICRITLTIFSNAGLVVMNCFRSGYLTILKIL